MTTPAIQCPSCEAPILAASRFCSSCGQELGRLSQLPTAMPRPAAAAASPARHISSDSIPAGGFTPGTIITGRYRVIGLLGRGGMGEVYRADDLKLGQPVALKFLPRALASDPVRRERFFAEVRITRQLAHPNICRAYDIAEADGQHFLSMEYIDGEDLASLIKRIGHLSNEKALDIARQLAAGLAAAHEKGVLHRDLKPANIMIDGHGRVRITDFGLAVAAADEEGGTNQIFGTPAYMAPEQFAGKGATTRSDIYALGLILYEIYSGKRAFTAATIAELREQKEGQSPKAPSEIRQGIDPVVERLIQRCLERDPRARPASVTQLALSLPGGDPLAAALAAGETPSPEMVAASGLKEGLRPAVAVGTLIWVIAASLVATVLGVRSMQRQGIDLGRSPAFLVQRAREFLRKAGYPETFAESPYGYGTRSPDAAADISADERARLRERNRVFWYRQSPQPLTPALSRLQGVTTNDPLMHFPEEVLVLLDTQGRLLSLDGVPPEAHAGAAARTVDWSLFFSEAGLDISQWTPVEPEGKPVFFADKREAWTGSLKDRPETPVRIEAAAYSGRAIRFGLVGPSTQDRPGIPSVNRRLTVGAILLAFLGLVLVFARHNLRLGRGDRRGARRLAGAIVVWMIAFWALGASHSIEGSVGLFLGIIPNLLLFSVFFWASYIAGEPFVRRRWPTILVSWTRLLAGEWRDPLVGRDVLAGCGFGAALAILNRVIYGNVVDPEAAMRIGKFLARVNESIGSATMVALAALFLLFFLRVLLRNDKLATVALGIVFLLVGQGIGSVFRLGDLDHWALALVAILAVLRVFVLQRFGLVAFAVALSVDRILRAFPPALQTDLWYSTASYGAIAIVAAIAFYGFHTSLGGRRILDTLDAG